jgi:NADH-quinone oxidoreductase subunit M
MYQKMMFGEIKHEENKNLTDLNLREIAVMAPIVILIFWIGIYPGPFLRIMEPSIEQVVERLETARTAEASLGQGLIMSARHEEPAVVESKESY